MLNLGDTVWARYNGVKWGRAETQKFLIVDIVEFLGHNLFVVEANEESKGVWRAVFIESDIESSEGCLWALEEDENNSVPLPATADHVLLFLAQHGWNVKLSFHEPVGMIRSLWAAELELEFGLDRRWGSGSTPLAALTSAVGTISLLSN